ncbi:MAG: sulfotransferase domain-containing protein [Planctomycetota bacterium]
MSKFPDRYLFTHHKCASNWMRKMIREFCAGRRWGYQVSGGLNKHPLEPAEGKPTFHIRTNARWMHAEALAPHLRAFNLIRDPRDALVSGYWYWHKAHAQKHDDNLKLDTRAALQELSFEDGLLHMLDHLQLLDDLKGWPVGKLEHILDVKYEDLTADTPGEMARIFKHLDIKPNPGEIDRIVENSSFQSMTGRKPGEEDTSSHFRKGVAGDWKNAFTPKVAEAFKDRFQADLVRLGYATDDSWLNEVQSNEPTTA